MRLFFKKYRYFLVIMLVIFFKYPSKPLKGDLVKIHIQYGNVINSEKGEFEVISREYEVTDKKELTTLAEKIGTIWIAIIPLYSNEGSPNWILVAIFSDGTTKKIYIDQDEINNGTKIQQYKLIEYLQNNYA